jgi:hypothetical protein
MAVFCLGPVAAPGLKRIYDWNKTSMVLILGLQLLPYCAELYSKSPWGWGSVAEPYHWQGSEIRHGVLAEEHLYQWIREHVPPLAIMVDNKPYVPVFARRSLFVARQTYEKPDDWWTRRNGWLMRSEYWLGRNIGHPLDEIRSRNQLVDALYSNSAAPAGVNLVSELRSITGDRPVFVIARNAQEKEALEHRTFLQKVVEEDRWSVYRVR